MSTIINGIGRVGIRNFVSATPTSLKLFIDAGNPLSYPGTGTTVTDLIGTQNGTLVNGVGYSSADGGKFTLDGVNDYISFGENQFNFPSFSISMWINLTGTTGFRVPIANLGYPSGGPNSNKLFGWETYIFPTTNQVVFDCYNGTLSGGSDRVSSVTNLSAGTWYHLCFTKINNGNMKLYINGSLNATKVTTTNPVYDVSHKTAIGVQRWESSIAYPFNGSVPITKIFNYELNSTEVTADFNEFKSRYGY